MKIKTKKEMNLPQLIEWGWDNDITNKEYICNEYEKKSVIFNLSGWAEFSDEFSYNPHDTFTVEIEEEITEDTKIPKLIEIGIGDLLGYSAVNKDISISEITDKQSLTLYILNDDLTMTLIWKNGELVE